MSADGISLPVEETATSVRRRFLGRSRTGHCLPLYARIQHSMFSTIADRDNLRRAPLQRLCKIAHISLSQSKEAQTCSPWCKRQSKNALPELIAGVRFHDGIETIKRPATTAAW